MMAADTSQRYRGDLLWPFDYQEINDIPIKIQFQ